jgi:hypothetical protein
MQSNQARSDAGLFVLGCVTGTGCPRTPIVARADARSNRTQSKAETPSIASQDKFAPAARKACKVGSPQQCPYSKESRMSRFASSAAPSSR